MKAVETDRMISHVVMLNNICQFLYNSFTFPFQRRTNDQAVMLLPPQPYHANIELNLRQINNIANPPTTSNVKSHNPYHSSLKILTHIYSSSPYPAPSLLLLPFSANFSFLNTPPTFSNNFPEVLSPFPAELLLLSP